jgi:phosphate/sulfate permease
MCQVERLASGLSHEPSVAVARLNVAAQGNKVSETAQFVGGVMGVGVHFIYACYEIMCVCVCVCVSVCVCVYFQSAKTEW